MEFRVYKGIIKGLLISAVVSILFYDSWIGMWIAAPAVPVMLRREKKRTEERKRKRLKEEFREVMVFVSGNLNAGYSLENAFLEVNKTEGKDFLIMKSELQWIANGLACGVRVETLLQTFARRYGVQEIMEFAGLIETAKYYGGNIPQLIRQMTENFTAMEEVETEIETVTAAKRLEARIMLCVPFAVIGMLRVLNPSYLEILYSSVLGRIWMTVCTAVIAGCAVWMERIVRIEV